MREYEVVYIFRPSLESEDVAARLEDFHDRLDGEITAVEHWGQRRLAYEIQDERTGYYVVAQFRADPASLAPFEQALRLDEELIRHLIVLSEGELPTPPSRRRAEEEEEEEDEDEVEEEEDLEDEDEEEGGEEEEDEVEDDIEDEEDEDVDEDEEEDAEDDADEDEASDDEEK